MSKAKSDSDAELVAQEILDEHSSTFEMLRHQEQLEPLRAELAEQVRANSMLLEKVTSLTKELEQLKIEIARLNIMKTALQDALWEGK